MQVARVSEKCVQEMLFKLGLLILCYRSLKVEELETDSRRNRINYTSVDSSAFLIILEYSTVYS